MYDMTDKCCLSCNSGSYAETGITDDYDGVLHCNACDHCVPRYLYSDKSELINTAFNNGFEKGVRQAKEEILQDFGDYVNDMKIFR